MLVVNATPEVAGLVSGDVNWNVEQVSSVEAVLALVQARTACSYFPHPL